MIYKFIFLFLLSTPSFGAELLTNCARFSNPPKWLTSTRVNRVASGVSRIMEWEIRRVEVVWYNTQKEFESAHSLGPLALAVAQRTSNKILLGPKVVESNFDQVFGHELVHITSEQKYKGAIPKWLEEGVANHVAGFGKIDYVSLNKRRLPSDVTKITHPMNGSSQDILNHYAISQALAEMISSKCDFRNILRLSVQRKMEDYFEKICKISNINESFKNWVKEKASQNQKKI